MDYDVFVRKTEEIEKLPIEQQKAFYEKFLKEEQEKSSARVLASFNYGALLYREGNFGKIVELLEPIVVDYQSYPYSTKLVSCFNLIGVATHCETEHSISRFFFQEALKIVQEHEDTFYYAFEYNDIALTYLEQKNFQEALHNLELAEKALPYCDEEMGAYIYINESICYYKLNRLEESLQAYKTSTDTYHSYDYIPDDALRCAVGLYYRLKDTEKYAQYKQEILSRMSEMNAPDVIDACKELFECGMDSDEDSLLTTILHFLDQYLLKYPEEIKIGQAVAEMKYTYALKQKDAEALIEALEKKNYYKDHIIANSEQNRVVALQQYMEINRQMQEAVASKEKANEAKTTFLLNMSHDIRTPMNAITGYSRMMSKKITDPELLHYLDRIEQSGSLLLSIINNVLDMSRIESGKMELDENYDEAGDIVNGVCEVFEEEAVKKNLTLLHSADVEHSHILCDRTKMQQLLTNLISNAVKYTPPGGTITITTKEKPCEKPGYVLFETVVKDTGIGISEEFLPHLFELFSRERDTTSAKVVGSGLGMAIVKSLVDLMHGTIHVDSEPGKGTAFTVTIPHKIADEIYYAHKALLDSVSSSVFKGKRILLAEDNDLNAEIALSLLKEMGLQADRVEDGILCVDKLEKEPAATYDLILMDIQMPHMNGYKATEIIRQLKDTEKASIPIIAMTANAFEEDKKMALEKGMNGHISKPIDIPSLKEVLVRFLK